MGFLKPPDNNSSNTPPVKLANINVTEAVISAALRILMGQRRLTQLLIYYSDFLAISHVQATASGGGGKGLGGGGGSSQPQTSYSYTAATMGALCSGPVNGLVNVWDTKGRYQQTSVTEGFTIPGGGGNYTVVNHALYKVDGGVGFAQAFSQGVNDFGSPGSTTLSGTYQVPMLPGAVPAPGVYAVNPATGTYSFHASDAGKVVQITYSFNLLSITNLEDASIPGSPFQILVDDSADFAQDQGVIFTATGVALVAVAASPGPGQYTVAAGLYTFNAADTAEAVAISYVTNTSNQQSDAATSLNLTLLNGAKGQTPWSYLSSRHPEAAIGYSEVAIIASPAMDLGSNAEMPNYAFEIAGPYQFGAGIPDCDPADCINALLQDPFFGLGFPAANIGDWTNASNFWVANSFFISPYIDSQDTVATIVGDILEAGMTANFWSEGLLKLGPYGDTSAAGNGQIYIAPTQPIVDLDDGDYIGDGLVKITRAAWQDANNKVQITWTNRANAYNSEVTTEQDDAAIQRYGLRTEDPQSWDFICTLAAAQFAGNLRVKRSTNIRAQYTISIKSNYCYLEPMDLVTLTVTEFGMLKTPVRIIKVVDNPDENGLEITAEEFPWGTAQPTLYSKQTGIGFKPNAGQADPGDTTALIFEATNRLGLQAGNVLYGFVTGQSRDWGGCSVYISFDGAKYDPLNGGTQISSPARIGSLINSLGVGSVDPDPSSFKVKMANAGAPLPSMSTADFDQLVSLCVLINAATDNPFELLAYKNATLVDKDTYQLDTLHRGQMGTANASHTAGETFARLDQASFVFQYDPSYYNKTIFFKFCSFNTLGGRPQPITQAAVYTFALPGNSPGAVDLNTGLYRPGIGNTQNGSGFPAFSLVKMPTEIDISWGSAVLSRGSMPLPSQSDNTLDQASLSGSVNVTGLSNTTQYSFFPYIDDKNPAAGVQFVNNSQVGGAVGTPAIAYTTASLNAAAFQQRNDHVPLAVPPITATTLAAGGGSSSGSGGGTQGVCPRWDMLVKRKIGDEWEVVRVLHLMEGDMIWGKKDGRDDWVRVRRLGHKTRRDWLALTFSCGEEIVVTPNHGWPTDRGLVPSTQITAEHVFYLEEGRTFLDGWKKVTGEALCIGIDLDSAEHSYYIGSAVPRVLTQNFIQAS